MERPNVLWITLESVRADHTPLYGYDRNTTPHLQRLCEREDATVLENGIAASIWTPPSSASMLTGTHLSTHDLGTDGKAGYKIPEDLETLPELLSGAGYETALFSSNSFLSSATGLDRGFDYSKFVRMTPSNFAGIDEVTRDSWRCLFDRFLANPTLDPGTLRRDVRDGKNDLVRDQARRWLKRRWSGTSPFFAYAHVFSPHHPYLPPSRYLDTYPSDAPLDVEEACSLVEDLYENGEEMARRVATGLDLTDGEWEAIRSLYDAEIRFADRTTHEMIEAARARSDRDLVVVVTADHGDLFGEHGLLSHDLVCHDGLIGVPMVTVGIDAIADGPDELSQHIDLTYTIAALAGAPTERFEGRDLREPGRWYAISQRGAADLESYREHDPGFGEEFLEDPITAVRTTEYKYVTDGRSETLYRLPDESRNRLADKPETARELAAVLDREGIEWSSGKSGERAEFDDETRERLRDLGYVQ